MPNEMTQCVDDQLSDNRMIRGDRVAGAGVVDQLARIIRKMAVIGQIVEAAHGKRCAVSVAFACVVEYEIEDHANAGCMQFRDGFTQLHHATGAEAWIERHEGDRIIAPAIGEAERRKMALVDPCGDRHEFDRIDTDLFQVCDNTGMGECRDGAADLFRNIGMQDGEGFYRDLVNEAAGGQERSRDFGFEVLRDDSSRHKVRGVDLIGRKVVICLERAIEFFGIRIDEQFYRIEP
ncbi:hypothetical protein D3C73_891460 [compost metagenome]